MGGFLRFFWRAIQTQPFTAIAGAAMTIAGVSYQDWLVGLAKDPPWPLQSHLIQLAIIAGGVLMLAFVFYRQSEEERADSHRIKRLRNRRCITFREIAEAISESNPAFSKNDVLTQLMTAVWRGHFSTWGGYSRLRYTFFDNNDEPEQARPLCRSPQDWLAEGVDVSNRNFERALFQAVMRGAPADRPGFLGSHVEALTLERPDFVRWYARFKSGRYED
jgi:hypothetical protein